MQEPIKENPIDAEITKLGDILKQYQVPSDSVIPIFEQAERIARAAINQVLAQFDED